MDMQTVCTLAAASDASEIAALVNRAYRPLPGARGWTDEADLISGPRTSPEQVLALFAPDSVVLVLRQGSEIVACVHVLHDSPASVYIGMLATEPTAQSRGLGKKMLSLAEQFAIDHFQASTFKMSVLSSRPELVAFYARRGYALTGAVADYPVTSGVGQPRIAGLHLEALVKRATGAG